MNLEELQTARDRERQTDKLQQLRETFYADAGEFIQQLRAERDRAAERADDPFDAPEVNQLTDEINTAEQTVEAIYEKRVGKIVKAASFAAADLPAESEGMTTEEQELFDTLVGNIKQNRQHVLDVLAGEETTDTEASSPTADETDEPTASDSGVSAADLMGSGGESENPETPERETVPPESPPQGHPPEAADSGSEPEIRRTEANEPDQPVGAGSQHQGDAVRNDGGQPTTSDTEPTAAPTTGSPEGTTEPDTPTVDERRGEERSEPAESTESSVERRTVRITDDIETFIGSDERDYDLQRDDVVALPESNASLLIERDAAKEL